MKRYLLLFIGFLLFSGCGQLRTVVFPSPTGDRVVQTSPSIAHPTTPSQPVSSPSLTGTTVPSVPSEMISTNTIIDNVIDHTREPSAQPSHTATATLGPDDWKKLPIFPKISHASIQTYQRGLELGNNSHAFSKIGDCGSTPAWFLGDFDLGVEFYSLGKYQYLENVIAQFAGSFERTSLGARSGFNASSLMVTIWTDPTSCDINETPLECEYRLHKPVFAFIMLGTNDIWNPEQFEPQMRRIIEYSIDNGIVPILSTKADNEEGDGSINATIARLALDYQIPLWNFWLAVQHLPDKGLQEDGVHLTWGRNFFDDPNDLSTAWTIRNLTALQVLDIVWQGVVNPNE